MAVAATAPAQPPSSRRAGSSKAACPSSGPWEPRMAQVMLLAVLCMGGGSLGRSPSGRGPCFPGDCSWFKAGSPNEHPTWGQCPAAQTSLGCPGVSCAVGCFSRLFSVATCPPASQGVNRMGAECQLLPVPASVPPGLALLGLAGRLLRAIPGDKASRVVPVPCPAAHSAFPLRRQLQ